MRERLESSDDLLSNLEAETDQIEKHMQRIDEALQKIETSISSASQRGDHDIAASFQKNLSQKKAEKEQQEQAIARIAAQLSQVGNEITAVREKNESSKQELAQLESLEEDTSDGQAQIQEREQTIQALEQRYRDLLNRLGKVGALEGLRLSPTVNAKISHLHGELAEKRAIPVIKSVVGFERGGAGLHYGRKGLDNYFIRNTPKGRTWASGEAKSTRDLSKHGSKEELLRSLNIGKDGLQQGSKLYAEDRLLHSAKGGNPVARHIRSGQASTGDNRIWQSRHYVFWRQSITAEEKLYRAISSSDGTKVADLKLIYHNPPRKR